MNKNMNLALVAQYEEAFRYLYELRDSGRTNMWGAVPYMVAELGMDEADAKVVHLHYIEHCKEIAEHLSIDI